jgi:hypothetical protein
VTKIAMPERFKWPPKCVLTFATRRGNIWHQTTERTLDLADFLMLNHPYSSRVVCMSVSTDAAKRDSWTEKRLQKIENLIRYDLRFDGYNVTINRKTRHRGANPPYCHVPFQWELQFRTAR